MGFIELLKSDKKIVASRFDRAKLLEHIENSVSKNDFVDWLNNQKKGAFSENDEWADIKEAVAAADISTAELYSFLSSISSEADVKKLLKDVEEQTSQAQITADKLSMLSTLKKFAVATGGASLLSGLLLIIAAAGVWAGLLPSFGLESAYLVAFGLFVGTLQFISGLLLVAE